MQFAFLTVPCISVRSFYSFVHSSELILRALISDSLNLIKGGCYCDGGWKKFEK